MSTTELNASMIRIDEKGNKLQVSNGEDNEGYEVDGTSERKIPKMDDGNVNEKLFVEEGHDVHRNPTHDYEEDHSWGWRGFKPKCLQWVNNPIGFMVFISIFGIVQGMVVNTFVNQSLPTLERRFAFSSRKAGFIPSSNDISAILLVAIVSYYGGSGHKPKWLGYGSICTGIGTLIFVLPQGLVGKYDPFGASVNLVRMCAPSNSTSPAAACTGGDTLSSSSGLYYFLFVLGQLVAGAGTTPLHTLGPAYFDENVKPQHIGIYLAVFYLTAFLGPAIGSLIGGKLMAVYIDIEMPPGPPIGLGDPRWMGAWWVAPLGGGLILILNGFLLFGFPRRLPNAQGIHSKKEEEQKKQQKKRLTEKLKDIYKATKSLFVNPVYICQNLGVTTATLVWMGIGPFMYKVFRDRYGASPMEAGIAIALLIFVGCGLGILAGGAIVRLRHIQGQRRAAKYTFFLQIVGIWSVWTFLIPGCSYTTYAGVDVPYLNRNITLHQPNALPYSSCNSQCHCDTAKFSPLCGPDGVTYYSACFAGCTASLGRGGFTNCSCVPNFNKTDEPAILKHGSCLKDCRNLNLLIGCFIGLAFLGLLTAVPSKIVTLRCVTPEERSYGLGIQFIFMRVFGSLPGPILVGFIIDQTCTLWKTVCGEHANCVNYDYERLGWIILYYGVPTQVLSVVFFGLTWYFSRNADRESSSNSMGRMEMKPTMNASHDQDNNIINEKV